MLYHLCNTTCEIKIKIHKKFLSVFLQEKKTIAKVQRNFAAKCLKL